MGAEESVESIISTYELSPKVRDKIRAIALQRVSEFHLQNFDEIYADISRIVDIFQTPYSEQIAFSLNDRVAQDTDTEFHEILADPLSYFEDNILTKLSPESPKNVGSGALLLREAVLLLSETLEKPHVEVINQLFERGINLGGMILNLSPAQLIEGSDLIKTRLEEIVNRYERDGRLYLPARPIKKIQFNPLFIRFYKRGFDGDPLDFFMRNYKVYGGLTRGELEKMDQSLYNALLKSGQLDTLIPESRTRPLTTDQVKTIMDSYTTYNRNAAEASRHLPYSRDTILKYWSLNGLKIRRNWRELTPEDWKSIDESYITCSGSATKVAGQLHHDRQTVLNRWKEKRFEIRRGKRLIQPEIDRIGQAYELCAGNATKAEKILGNDRQTISSYWRKLGFLTD